MITLSTSDAKKIQLLLRYVSSTCQIRDPISGHQFDVRSLRNATSDYQVGHNITLNVCGSLVSPPSSVASVGVAAYSQSHDGIKVDIYFYLIKVFIVTYWHDTVVTSDSFITTLEIIVWDTTFLVVFSSLNHF